LAHLFVKVPRPGDLYSERDETVCIHHNTLLICYFPFIFQIFTGTPIHQHKRTETNNNIKFQSVIAGLSNTYADYITTFEEYQVLFYS